MTRLRALLLALALAPTSLAAQAVVGTVVDEATRQPITGAMVRLMERGTWTGRLFLTAADGRFQLRAPGPGRYHLRVERIGFAETTVGPVDLEGDESLLYDVAVRTQPIRLEGLDVSAGRRRCSLRGDAAGATQALWDEVRKALDAARWTEQEAGLQFQVVQKTRSLDERGLRVLDEQRLITTLYGGNTVRTLPPEDLAGGGYVREQDFFIYYYGPDATVLLSDEFLDTHCFRVAEARDDEPELVGLEFEPMRGQSADITGVLWIHRTTARLDRVEFTYTGLGRRPGAELAGGRVDFAELSDGRWIVRDWSIRAPLLGLARQFVAGVLRERVAVTGVQETGTEVISATGSEVSWRADIPWGGVRGVVRDSVNGGFLAGAEVALGGRSRLTRSDADGRFELSDVAPGTYWVSFDHQVLEDLGVYPAWQQVTVEPDSVAEVGLAVPSMASIRALQCRGQALAVGRVTDGLGGEGVPGAVITGVPVDGPGGMPLSAVTDNDGWYWLCGSQQGGAVRLVARLGPIRSSPSDAAPSGEGGFSVVDLVLPLSTAGTTMGEAVGDGRASLLGTVLDARTRAVVEGALVQLLGPGGEAVAQGLSDSRGRVLLIPDEPGTYQLRSERLGYGDTEGASVELTQGTRRVEIRMDTEAIPLEEMVVTVRGTVPVLERAGFYQRELMADGHFITREDIERVPVLRTSDLLIRAPGLGPVTFEEESLETTKRRIQFSRARSAVDRRCLPAIYLDGALIREGGIFSPLDPPSRWATEEELVSPQNIEAVELYASALSVPVRFQGPGSQCGVVVFWSRPGIGR